MLAKVVTISRSNMHLLPPFQRPELDRDGVHLTAASGKLFIEHLFNAADELIHRQSLPADVKSRHADLEVMGIAHQAAVTTNRLDALEEMCSFRHARFLEEQDGRRNEDSERRLVLTGVKRVLGHGAELQTALKNAATSVFQKAVPTFGARLTFVRQVQVRGDKCLWLVDFANRAEAVEIRRSFGQFMKREKGNAPPEVRSVFCSASQTFSTRIRVMILREISARHGERNPGLKVYTNPFTSRPVLHIHPDNRPMEVLTFVDSVLRFGHLLSKDFISKMSTFARTNLSGRLKESFIVLSDELPKRTAAQGEGQQEAAGSNSVNMGSAANSSGAEDVSMSGSTSASTPTGKKRARIDEYFTSSQKQ